MYIRNNNVYMEFAVRHKETKPVNPKGNQPLIFIGRTDAEAEAPCELSADFVFRCPGFQHDGPLVTSPALGFLRVPLLPQELR